jgi:hypothetical protein
MSSRHPTTFRAEATRDGAMVKLSFGCPEGDVDLLSPTASATAIMLGLAAATTDSLKNAGREDLPVIAPVGLGVGRKRDVAKLVLDFYAPGGGRILFEIDPSSAAKLRDQIDALLEEMASGPSDAPEVMIRRLPAASKKSGRKTSAPN